MERLDDKMWVEYKILLNSLSLSLLLDSYMTLLSNNIVQPTAIGLAEDRHGSCKYGLQQKGLLTYMNNVRRK